MSILLGLLAEYPSTSMRVLHVTPSLEATSGGPAQVVAGLSSALARRGVEVTVVCTLPPQVGFSALVPVDPQVEVQTFLRGRFSKVWNAYSRPLARFIESEIPNYDLVHIHELWHYPEYIVSRTAGKFSVPTVISPHGCLAPRALANDRWLKLFYTRLVQRPVLQHADMVLAVTNEEADQIRSYGVTTRTQVIPLGVDPVIANDAGKTRDELHQDPSHAGQFNVLYLGRVVPNKGVDLLIHSLAELKHLRPTVRLVLAGPCADNYRKSLMTLSAQLGVNDRTSFVGFVTGPEKAATYANADLFVLPSYSEGFSVAVLEAMAHGLPVVLSHQCNFPEAAVEGAGLLIEPNTQQLSAAIEELMVDPVRINKMGQRGQKLIQERYAWDATVPEYLAAYQAIWPVAAPGPA